MDGYQSVWGPGVGDPCTTVLRDPQLVESEDTELRICTAHCTVIHRSSTAGNVVPLTPSLFKDQLYLVVSLVSFHMEHFLGFSLSFMTLTFWENIVRF